MKRILLDTNVVLDVLLDRQPQVGASASVWASVEKGVVEGVAAVHAVRTIHYLARKELGNMKVKRITAAILRVFGVAAINMAVVQEALELPSIDFEDAVTMAAALSDGCDCIVTRDPKGFRGSPVRTLTPEAVAPLLRG